MAQKSISEFRAEKGITLKELSEMTGVSEEELLSADELKPVPPQIEKLIIDEYLLAPNYFSGISITEPPKHCKISNYLGLSFGWSVLSSLLSSLLVVLLPSVIIALNNFTGIISEYTLSLILKILAAVGAVIGGVVFVFACKWLANRLRNVHGFAPEHRKYTYFYYIIPFGIGAMLNELGSWLEALLSGNAPLIAGVLESFIMLVGTAVTVIVLALIIKSVKNGEKDAKILNGIYISFVICTVISIILRIITGILSGSFKENSGILTFVIGRAQEILEIAIVLSLMYKKERNEESEKLLYTVLPIVIIAVLPLFSVTSALIFNS